MPRSWIVTQCRSDRCNRSRFKISWWKIIKNLSEPDPKAVEKGCANLEKHLENARQFNLPAIVAINKFVSDSPEELAVIKERSSMYGAEAVYSEVWAKGGEGAIELAEKVAHVADNWNQKFIPCYELDWTPEQKYLQ